MDKIPKEKKIEKTGKNKQTGGCKKFKTNVKTTKWCEKEKDLGGRNQKKKNTKARGTTDQKTKKTRKSHGVCKKIFKGPPRETPRENQGDRNKQKQKDGGGGGSPTG